MCRGTKLARELERMQAWGEAMDPEFHLQGGHKRGRRLMYEKRQRAAHRAFERDLTHAEPSRLRSFLDQYLGWDWDDVRADLCRRFTRPFFRYRIIERLKWEVSTQVMLTDEAPSSEVLHGRWKPFYVCPVTGRFKRPTPTGIHGLIRRRVAHQRLLNERQQLLRREGRWWMVELSPTPPRADWEETYDVTLSATLASVDVSYAVPCALEAVHVQKGVYASSMRPLTLHELFVHGLTRRAPGIRGRVCRHLDVHRMAA